MKSLFSFEIQRPEIDNVLYEEIIYHLPAIKASVAALGFLSSPPGNHTTFVLILIYNVHKITLK